jgi:hypothetical protein
LQRFILGAIGLLMAGGAMPVSQAKDARDVSRDAASPCNRECLNGFVDKYLSALIAHDPAKLPLAKDVKFTENGQVLEIGDGLWRTASSIGTYKLYVADPEAGQVALIGTLDENGTFDVLAVRLKVVSGAVSEIETIVSRKDGDSPTRPDAFTEPKPVFLETLAPSERVSRKAMVAIANSYFEGLEKATGKFVPFDPECNRRENGTQTTNNPAMGPWMAKLGCAEQFNTGFSKFVTRIPGRRYPVVDEERGLVLSFVAFEHAGHIKNVTLTDGANLVVPPPFTHPFQFQIAELFKIKSGKIRQIEAVLLTVPYGMKSGW